MKRPWTEGEDRKLKGLQRSRMAPAFIAAKLGRPEKSIIVRAIALKCPFEVKA